LLTQVLSASPLLGILLRNILFILDIIIFYTIDKSITNILVTDIVIYKDVLYHIVNIFEGIFFVIYSIECRIKSIQVAENL
jgi:hypothetical protein